MKKALIAISTIFLSSYSVAFEQYQLPPFDYINIVSIWSSHPNIYLDSMGNIRIKSYCDKLKVVDKKVDKSVFDKAARSLIKMRFFSIPDNADLKYEEENGEVYPTHTRCDHCSELYVTFKYRDYLNTSKFEKINKSSTVQKYDNIANIMDDILKPFDGLTCEKSH